MSKNRGVSFIEVILIVGLFAVVGTSSTPFFSHFLLRNNVDTTTQTVINVIRKAQNYSMNQKSGATWGACVTGGSIRLFSGSCIAPTFRQDTPVPPGVTVSGLTSVTFSKLRGEPSSSVTITVSSSLKSKTVSVNSAGGMDTNL